MYEWMWMWTGIWTSIWTEEYERECVLSCHPTISAAATLISLADSSENLKWFGGIRSVLAWGPSKHNAHCARHKLKSIIPNRTTTEGGRHWGPSMNRFENSIFNWKTIKWCGWSWTVGSLNYEPVQEECKEWSRTSKLDDSSGINLILSTSKVFAVFLKTLTLCPEVQCKLS